MKKQTGITLVALVITIIVLLILAGVSIKLIFGSEGLLGKATASVDTHNIGTAKEQVELKIAELKSEYYEKRYATAEIEIDVQSGDWIFNQCEGDTIDTENYQFTITLPTGKETADAENPYIVTILKSKKLLSKVTGTLSIDGILTWDENFLADSGDEGGNENPVEHGTTMELKGPITIGSVTYSDSYEIWNKSQLEDFRNKVNNGEKFENCIITQKADINLNSENWTPIGDANNSKPFSGTYDGKNHIIKDLSIDNSTYYQGLFGYVKSGTINNVTVEGNVKGGAGSAGLAAYVIDGKIDGCTNKADVTNYNNYISLGKWNIDNDITVIGGISAIVEGTTHITNTSNDGNITLCSTGAWYTDGAGIVGWVSNKENGVVIKKCNNSKKVQVSQVDISTKHLRIGGIVAELSGGNVIECYNTGEISTIETSNITEYNSVGGIVGHCSKISNSLNNTIEKCWNCGVIESSVVGGIVGTSYDGNFTIKNCYNVEKINCNSECGIRSEWGIAGGGIIGWNRLGTTVENCYNKGEIEIKSEYTTAETTPMQCGGIGGIAGENVGIVKNCYNQGTIKAYQSTSAKRSIVARWINGQIEWHGLFPKLL